MKAEDAEPAVPSDGALSNHELALAKLVRTGAAHTEVEAFIQSHPSIDLNAQCDSGATVVHWAALLGQLDTLKCILRRGTAGFDVRAATTLMYPLHWACTSGKLRVAQWLIEDGGADINAQDVKGTTPLMIAAQYHHTSLVEYLMTAGADAAILDNDADSALHWAAYKDAAMSIKPLLYRPPPAQRVSPTAMDAFGSTPLHLAASQGSCKALALLLTHGDGPAAVALSDKKGRTPLQVAAERGQHATRRLLEAHAAGKRVDPDDFSLTMPPMDLWWRDALDQGASALQQISERLGLATATAEARPSDDAAVGRTPPPAREMTEIKPSDKPAVLEMKPVVEDGGELI